MSYLFQKAGQVCTLAGILEHVWGDPYLGSPQYVHVYISSLRGKLEENPKNPQYIVTEYRNGYRFVKKEAGLG